MSRIELRFIRERNPFSLLVSMYLWSSVSHVEILVPGKGYLGARPSKGVQLRPFNYLKPVKEFIGTVQCTDEQASGIIDYATRQIGKPYDWFNFLGETLHQDWTQEPGKWICSVLVWAACHSVGIDLVNPENVDRPTPKDLMESPLVTNLRRTK